MNIDRFKKTTWLSCIQARSFIKKPENGAPQKKVLTLHLKYQIILNINSHDFSF